MRQVGLGHHPIYYEQPSARRSVLQPGQPAHPLLLQLCSSYNHLILFWNLHSQTMHSLEESGVRNLAIWQRKGRRSPLAWTGGDPSAPNSQV